MTDMKDLQPGDEGSVYSEQTPVPNRYRPPPPTFQPTTMAAKRASVKGTGSAERHRHQENSLLNSTLLSLSVDEVGTLPSLAFNPPSPLSQPSQSLFDDHKENSSQLMNRYTTRTPTNARSPSTLSLARKRRQQRVQNGSTTSDLSRDSNRNGKKNPPMQEVYMKENKSSSDATNPTDSQDANDNDTFLDCVEDRSLANRARQTLQSESYSPSPSVVSSLDGHPAMPNQYSGQRLENIDETIGSGDVVRVHESALNALQQLKEELVKANQRNEELTREKEIWKEEEQHLRQEITALKSSDRQKEADLQRLREDHERLRDDKENTEMQRSNLAEEKKKLDAQSRESTRTIKEFRHRILAGDNRHKELKGQLDKLNVELESALSAKGEMAAEIAQAQTERMELESTMEKLRKQLSEATQERDQTSSNGQRFEEALRIERKKLQDLRASSDAEIGRLNGSLRKANEALHRLRAELTPKVRSAVQHNNSMISTGSNSPGIEFGPAPTLDSAIADRMARLRDSAERAHLVRGHKRELARVKSDRDAKVRQLESDHSDTLKKITKQLESKRKSELEELAKKLKEEHESHLEEVEEEHQKRLSQLQTDFGRSQEDSEENLEEALHKISRLTQDYGREKGRRHALERTVEDLQRKMKAQQKDMKAKHGADLEKSKRQWESEKETLLGNLQRDCNNAFASHRRANNIQHVETSDAYRPHTSSSQQQRQQQSTGPSPLSMSSATFFPENKNHPKFTAPVVDAPVATSGATEGGAAYIVPSPRHMLNSSPMEIFRSIGGSPSVISKSYSDVDIDSVLRETEELVQSIL